MRYLFLFLMLVGCATPRLGGIISKKFSDQASTALMNVECNGIKSQVRGVFICEEKEPKVTKLEVKIMPAPGRVIYSNGLEKKVEDFNWGKTGFWFWKKQRITDTWVTLDLGELNSVFGDTPIAFDVAGSTKDGVIVNRGIFYHRKCNDRDIPCSYLKVKYECLGEAKNTYNNQLGYCNRMAGSAHSFEIPLKTPEYTFKAGSKIVIVSGKSGFSQVVDVKSDDVDRGSVKFSYPEVPVGPDLIGFRVNYLEQGVQQFKQTYVLLVGYDSAWTGVDKPHYTSSRSGIEFSLPILADMMEIVEGSDRKVLYSGQETWDVPNTKVCAYAWHRISGDVEKTCLDSSLKEVE